ncbi:MAG: hypothetical protein M3O03_12770, partial [Pseudomonadota bacterium]|nr:hypothetical protein [Pseudomonadota bacterium]
MAYVIEVEAFYDLKLRDQVAQRLYLDWQKTPPEVPNGMITQKFHERRHYFCDESRDSYGAYCCNPERNLYFQESCLYKSRMTAFTRLRIISRELPRRTIIPLFIGFAAL